MGTLLGPKWQFLDVAGDLKEAGQVQLDNQVWPVWYGFSSCPLLGRIKQKLAHPITFLKKFVSARPLTAAGSVASSSVLPDKLGPTVDQYNSNSKNWRSNIAS